MLLTETKIPDMAYLHNRQGYDFVCSQSVSTVAMGEKGGVVLVVREGREGCSVELARFRGPNMASC